VSASTPSPPPPPPHPSTSPRRRCGKRQAAWRTLASPTPSTPFPSPPPTPLAQGDQINGGHRPTFRSIALQAAPYHPCSSTRSPILRKLEQRFLAALTNANVKVEVCMCANIYLCKCLQHFANICMCIYMYSQTCASQQMFQHLHLHSYVISQLTFNVASFPP